MFEHAEKLISQHFYFVLVPSVFLNDKSSSPLNLRQVYQSLPRDQATDSGQLKGIYTTCYSGSSMGNWK